MDNLPCEVLEMILDYLPLPQMIHNRQVCKVWQYTIENYCLPRRHSLKVYQSSIHMTSYNAFCADQKLSLFAPENRALISENDRIISSTMGEHSDSMAVFVCKHLKNVRHVTFACDDLSKISLNVILDQLTKIRSIALMDYYLCSHIRDPSYCDIVIRNLNDYPMDSLMIINLRTNRRGLHDHTEFPLGTWGTSLYGVTTFSSANCTVPFDRLLRKFDDQIRKVNVQTMQISMWDIEENIVGANLLRSPIFRNLTHFAAQSLDSTLEPLIFEKTLEIICHFENLSYLDMTFADCLSLKDSLARLHLLPRLSHLRMALNGSNTKNHEEWNPLPRPVFTVSRLNLDVLQTSVMKGDPKWMDFIVRTFPNVEHFQIDGRRTIDVWYRLLSQDTRNTIRGHFQLRANAFSRLKHFMFFHRQNSPA